MEWTFTIDGRLPGMNEIISSARAGWAVSASQKRKFTELCARAAFSAGMPILKQFPVRLSIVWFEPNDRRDVDNVCAGAKFVCDGLVAAKVLPDDNRKFVAGIDNVVVTDKAHPRVVVRIKQTEEAQ